MDDLIDLEEYSRGGKKVPAAGRYRVRIDDKRHVIDDPKPTGRQLLNLAGVRPAEEHLLFLLLHGGGLEEIQLDELVELFRPGVERFMTFESSASYRLEIDGQRFEWGAKLITGLKLKELAGVDPNTYALWREVRGGEDLLVSNDQVVDLSEDGLERFFTVIEQTTAGDGENGGALPRRDRRYLADVGRNYAEANSGNQIGVVFEGFLLPKGVFDHEKVDVLVLLPPGYPDVSPDMFYCSPWLRRSDNNQYPNCADQPFQFAGKSWQRWSRHNNQWRSGTDGIWTMIKRIERALSEVV